MAHASLLSLAYKMSLETLLSGRIRLMYPGGGHGLLDMGRWASYAIKMQPSWVHSLVEYNPPPQNRGINSRRGHAKFNRESRYVAATV